MNSRNQQRSSVSQLSKQDRQLNYNQYVMIPAGLTRLPHLNDLAESTACLLTRCVLYAIWPSSEEHFGKECVLNPVLDF